jgi:hypothetical protein
MDKEIICKFSIVTGGDQNMYCASITEITSVGRFSNADPVPASVLTMRIDCHFLKCENRTETRTQVLT